MSLSAPPHADVLSPQMIVIHNENDVYNRHQQNRQHNDDDDDSDDDEEDDDDDDDHDDDDDDDDDAGRDDDNDDDGDDDDEDEDEDDDDVGPEDDYFFLQNMIRLSHQLMQGIKRTVYPEYSSGIIRDRFDEDITANQLYTVFYTKCVLIQLISIASHQTPQRCAILWYTILCECVGKPSNTFSPTQRRAK